MSISQRTSITLQVPASTSNCGPGFDTLGIALSLYNFVRVELTPDAGQPVTYAAHEQPHADADTDAFGTTAGTAASARVDTHGGAGGAAGSTAAAAEAQHARTEAMAKDVAAAFAKATGITPQPFTFEVWGQVPPARGLGSSATVRCGILAGLNHLHGSPLTKHKLARIGSALDEAADNTVALLHGGFTVARVTPASGTFADCLRCDVDERVSFCVVSPQTQVLTAKSRAVLPELFPFADAVRSINSACTLTAAFFSRDYERLRYGVTDFMHQPYRSTLCPFMNEAIAAGEAAGAWCGWLSGSGSSVLCVGPKERSAAITKAMSDIYARQGIAHQSFQLSADNHGLRPVDPQPLS